MFAREWLASGRGAAMFFALLFSLLAPEPVAAQDQNPRPGYEQLSFHQDAFVQSAGKVVAKKASRPSMPAAILAGGAAASEDISFHPFHPASETPIAGESTSAAPYSARAPPAA